MIAVMPVDTPYTAKLEGKDPIAAMRETPERIRAAAASWSPPQFDRSYAPGKWTARQILIHLAQSELALGNRARMALSTPNYVAQPFNQDDWLARDSAMSGKEALAAFLAIATMNRAMFESLSAADRQTPLQHPEYGSLTVDWILYQLAGHQIHHLIQLQQIAGET
jgi:uncharacterized damage-inducible protein DinB